MRHRLRTNLLPPAHPSVASQSSPTARPSLSAASVRGGTHRSVQAYGERLAADAQADMEMRFKPVAAAAGVDVATSVATVEGHASAAMIAEAIVSNAKASSTDMLVIASHGGCGCPSSLLTTKGFDQKHSTVGP